MATDRTRSRGFALSCLLAALAPAGARAQAFEACIETVLAATPGRVVKVERKDSDGRAAYEFDVRDVAGRDWNVVCALASREIVETEREVTSASDPLFARRAGHDEYAARQAALAVRPGVIQEVEYEIEADGGATYEFDIVDAEGEEAKIEISAETLEVLEYAIEHWQVGLE